jgi:acyl-coenzyme A synthetase/AMP-(fatty) acid ligase
LTGDLGTIEADGRIRFRGRLKEMIKTGGVNVAPLEVEQVLLQHPDIVQAYLVGVPDRSKSEIVAAAVELRGGRQGASVDPGVLARHIGGSPVCTRLAAGGRWIRTIGTPPIF